MGIQTMGSQTNGQQSHLHTCQMTRENSWYNLTLNEVQNQLGNLGEPLGSMNLDELLKNVWSSEANRSSGMGIESISSEFSFQSHQASLSLARALSGKTVDQVWREIQQEQKKRNGDEVKGTEGETSLGETTLEDFLIKAGLYAETTVEPNRSMELVPVETMTSGRSMELVPIEILTSGNMTLSPSPSIGALSDPVSSGWKRDTSDALEGSIERKLRRKIKNRESAARSRARKQAYHNELVSKVSRLEEENFKLKKEKEFDNKFPSEQRYQLRRTSSM